MCAFSYSGSELGKKIAVFHDKGDFIPNDLVIELLESTLSFKNFNGCILDGYPRTEEQTKSLDVILKKLDIEIYTIIRIMKDDESIIKRLESREICSKCGISYNEQNPPKIAGKCNDCDSSLVRRKDDNIEVVKKKLKIYGKEIKPLITHYNSTLVKNVNS